MSGKKDQRETTEIKLDPNEGPATRNAWLEALEDLGGAAPSTTPKKPTGEPRTESEADVMVSDAREKILSAKAALEDFVKAHPYLIAPNVHRMWEDNLREIVVMMDRERARASGGDK